MNKKIVKTAQAPGAVGPYSQAVKAGNFVYCSGQIGLTPAGQMAGETIEVQTRQILENLKNVLQAAGSSLEKVVITTVYLKNMEDYKKMNEIYAGYFKLGPPARAAVEVSRLPKDVLIEIEATALAWKTDRDRV